MPQVVPPDTVSTSLFLRSQLDPEWTSAHLNFVLFLSAGDGAFVPAFLADPAADRRGDAGCSSFRLPTPLRVVSWAVHATGTPGALLHGDLPGFQVAIQMSTAVRGGFAASTLVETLSPASQRQLSATAMVCSAVWWRLWRCG
jgi:hypothetical protein